MLNLEGQQRAVHIMVGTKKIEEQTSEIVLGWGDFPVTLQHEEHPSYDTRSSALISNRCDKFFEPFGTTPIVSHSVGDSASLLRHCGNRCSEHVASSANMTTFGWGDFPVVVESSHASPTTATNIDVMPRASLLQNNSQVDVKAVQRNQTNNYENTMPSTSSSDVNFPTVFSAPTKDTDKLHSYSLKAPSPTSSTATLNVCTEKACRSVTFGTVHVRSYNLQLGDHPLCPYYPLSLDWTYSTEAAVLSVTDHQAMLAISAQQRDSNTMPGQKRAKRVASIPVTERRQRLAEHLQLSLDQVDELEEARRRLVANEAILHQQHCNSMNDDDDVDDDDTGDWSRDNGTTSSTRCETPSLLPRVATNYVLLPSTTGMYATTANTVHTTAAATATAATTNAITASNQCLSSPKGGWWNDDIRSTTPSSPYSYSWLEYENDELYDTSQNAHTNNSNDTAIMTAWQVNLLEMNMHINGHVVHPGFEIQIYQ